MYLYGKDNIKINFFLTLIVLSLTNQSRSSKSLKAVSKIQSNELMKIEVK